MGILFQSLGYGLGVLVGIMVGVVISIVVQRWEQRHARDAQFKSLVAEMRFNVGKIQAWLDELARCRTAIVEDRLHDWYGFFDLHSSIFQVANDLFTSGQIHERFGFELINDLQMAASELSVNGTDYMNRQFAEERDRFGRCLAEMNLGLWMQRKPEALRIVDFWETKLRRHQGTFTSVMDALETSFPKD